MRPVLDAVAFEPFLLGRRAHEALEIAARMQALAAPVGGREQRHLDLRPVRHARLPIFVGIELAGETVLVEVPPVGAELFLGELDRARHPVAVHAALEAARAAPVLERVDLRARPVVRETVAENAAVMRHVAIEVGGALPQADRGQVLWLQRRALPLVLGVVGDAVQPDLAVRPRLHARPFDAGGEVHRLAARPDVDHARASGRRRGCRRECTRSRPAPISPDRRPPSTGTCWSSPLGTSGWSAHMRRHCSV